MIILDKELIWGVAASVGGILVAAGKWLLKRAIQQFEKRLNNHEDRIAAIEMDYVSKETLRLAVGEIKETIDTWGTDMRHGVDNAHSRLDTIYNQLLRRGD